jgi:hypothetical protein
MQAPQNWRREMAQWYRTCRGVIPRGESRSVGNMEATPEILGFFRKSAVYDPATITTSIANGELWLSAMDPRLVRRAQALFARVGGSIGSI